MTNQVTEIGIQVATHSVQHLGWPEAVVFIALAALLGWMFHCFTR